MKLDKALFFLSALFVLTSCSLTNNNNQNPEPEPTPEPEPQYSFEEPTYNWSDDHSSCTATRVCVEDASKTETETVDSTFDVVTPETCEGEGAGRYTATFTNTAFETQTYDEIILPSGHKYGEPTYTWSDDYFSCTATRVCLKDDSHVEIETANAEFITITEADDLHDGLGKYVVNFENTAFESQTEEVVIPKPIDPDSVYILSSTKDYYIAYCRNSSVEHDDLVIRDTFAGLPVKKIGVNAYRRCSYKTVTLPNTIESIGYMAFYKCNSLTTVNFPSSLKEIANYAFGDTPLSEEIHFTSAVTIGERAFVKYPGSNNLKKVVFEVGGSEINSSFPAALEELVCDETTVLNTGTLNLTNLNEYNGVYYLGAGDNPYYCAMKSDENLEVETFHPDCKQITGTHYGIRIETPSQVTSIKTVSFPKCEVFVMNDNLERYLTPSRAFGYKVLKTVVLGRSLVEIAPRAFDDCETIRQVINLSSLVISPGSIYFGYVAETVSIVSNSLDDFAITTEDYVYTPSGYLIDYIGESKDVVVPEYIGETQIKVIGSYSFNSKSITSIQLPESITQIGDRAFLSNNFDEIFIPVNVTKIGDYCFDVNVSYSVDENNTKVHTSGNVLRVGNDIVRANNKVATVYISWQETVRSYAFFNSSVETIEINGGNFHPSSFSGCKSLRTITHYGTSNFYISNDAFRNCTSLTNVDLTYSGGNYIAQNAFYGCTSLKKVTLGSHIKTIDSYAFYQCPIETMNLESVTRFNDNCLGSAKNRLTLSDETTYIGTYAIGGYGGYGRLRLPNKLVTLKPQTASYYSADEECENFVVENECVYSKDHKELYVWKESSIPVVHTTVIPEGIEVLKPRCISNPEGSTVLIPTTIKRIEQEAFRYSSTKFNIKYAGTTEQFRMIDLADDYISNGVNVLIYTITCTDGTVPTCDAS